ncbi:MAG: GNAT family N-acetyltransferase [Betaproteobacteria bacterium]
MIEPLADPALAPALPALAPVNPVLAPGFPAESVELRVLPDGRPLLLRPLVPGDAERLQDFVRALSPASRYQRFQNGLRELSPGLLARMTDLDHAERMAFVAVLPGQGRERLVGEARYAPTLDRPGVAEFAVAVADDWQRRGIGAWLFDKLLGHAAASGIARLHGDVLHDNAAMIALARRRGFALRPHPDGARLLRVER